MEILTRSTFSENSRNLYKEEGIEECSSEVLVDVEVRAVCNSQRYFKNMTEWCERIQDNFIDLLGLED